MMGHLNQRAMRLLETQTANAEALGIKNYTLPSGGSWWDFGIDAPGGLEAGRLLSAICMSDLARVDLVPGMIGSQSWPHVQVSTDHPTEACLLSQYAGWKVATGSFFGMGSGPIRAVAASEELFAKLDYQEFSQTAIGVLETEKPPTEEVLQEFAKKTGVEPAQIVLLAARTSSLAGTFQIVSRSVETTLHKLFELGFDVRRIQSALGTAPLPPSGADFFTSLGQTNDAILYGGRVHLWVSGDVESINAIGPQVPSSSSEAHGKPFRELFEAAGGDFFAIDAHLFSPAEVVFNSLDTGQVFRFGEVAWDLVNRSFGL